MTSKGIFLKKPTTPSLAQPLNYHKEEKRNEKILLAINYLNQSIATIVQDGCKCNESNKCSNCSLINGIRSNINYLYQELNKENTVQDDFIWHDYD